MILVYIPIQRYSKDKTNINNYGNKILELCKSLGIYIVNGRISEDKYIGSVTTSKNTLIDYVIVSPSLFSHISYFNVANFDPILSDIHCPVVVYFDYNASIGSNTDTCNDIDENVNFIKPKWKSNNSNVFIDNLNSDDIDDLVQTLEHIDLNSINVDIVNEVVFNCNSIIKNAAEKADMFVESKVRPKPTRVNYCKPFFNRECYLKRKEYRKCKNLHCRLCRAETKEKLVCNSREYKRTLNK